MDFQFYPTPLNIAQRAWAMFENKKPARLLEPSAGNGDLLNGIPNFNTSKLHWRLKVDVCEIDIKKHPILRELDDVTVVGTDFLEFENGAIYSHIFMNPPFHNGVKHMLKAWDIAWDCEIVGIINAQTIKNPHSQERKFLVSLIERFGRVEFVEDAFKGEGVEREAEVEIAIVYLRKRSNAGDFSTESVIGNLQGENFVDKANEFSAEHDGFNDLVVPASVIENAVASFNIATKFMRASVLAEVKANHFSARLGQTMAALVSQQNEIQTDTSVNWVRSEICTRYINLKDRAWAGMLRSTDFTALLSSSAQRRVEAEFDNIKSLEFNFDNVVGFLRGLIENQSEIQMGMACDVFDLISRYHTKNLCFYKGWKSNDKHRTCGMKLKKSRFIIPGNGSYGNSLDWSCLNRLVDFDKVFRMLDDNPPEADEVETLKAVFERRFADLKNGERVSTAYFDVRFYPQAGTIHFFPTNEKVLDKLNMLVGLKRQWLPPASENVAPTFWEQYEKSDSFDKSFRKEVDDLYEKSRNPRFSSRWDHPLTAMYRDNDDGVKALELMSDAMDIVLVANGISTDFRLESNVKGSEQLCLTMD